MTVYLRILFCLFCLIITTVADNLPEMGYEVRPGSVLLPSSRRGRFLANIIKRQAVDGTEIRFNEDADQINAEAKKKEDVLADELLPLVIGEQERRATLYSRIMTAIQNGEKGVTIAEFINKPPLIIRKGVMFRCPSNRDPIEPDGSGMPLCEDDIHPTEVIYDSCLSAEDKELYVSKKNYFFCNRHAIEGPDLPFNGTVAIACPPHERTSLQYTTKKCALGDTYDVVVHYRYYPDKTRKAPNNLDPNREICDHWNPCQIGYIFSLTSADSAVKADDYWSRRTDYEHDEIVPQDTPAEYVPSNAKSYTTSHKKIDVPDGYQLQKLFAKRSVDGYSWDLNENPFDVEVTMENSTNFHTVELTLPEPIVDFYYADYYGKFKKLDSTYPGPETLNQLFLSLRPSEAIVNPENLTEDETKDVSIPFHCKCTVSGIVFRSRLGSVLNIDKRKYSLVNKTKHHIEMNLANMGNLGSGEYFAITTNENYGTEERIKILTIEESKDEKDDFTNYHKDDDSKDSPNNLTTRKNVNGQNIDYDSLMNEADSVLSPEKVEQNLSDVIQKNIEKPDNPTKLSTINITKSNEDNDKKAEDSHSQSDNEKPNSPTKLSTVNKTKGNEENKKKVEDSSTEKPNNPVKLSAANKTEGNEQDEKKAEVSPTENPYNPNKLSTVNKTGGNEDDQIKAEDSPSDTEKPDSLPKDSTINNTEGSQQKKEK